MGRPRVGLPDEGSREVEPRRKRRRSPSDVRRKIERASRQRKDARAEGNREDAQQLDAKLLGRDRGQGPRSRVGRGKSRHGRFDPYTDGPAPEGLFADLRSERGER